MLNKLSFQQDDALISLVVDKNVYKPIEYIALDGERIHGRKMLTWAKDHFASYGFDFDPYSMLLWPMSDDVPASVVASRINAAYPNLATIKVVSPALAHGLDEVASLSFDDRYDDDQFDQPDINLSF
jgi:hypothetical protein